jgi:hypothetical protein
VSEQPRAPRDLELQSSHAGDAFCAGRATSWFISQGGKTEGPLSAQRIAQLIRWGKISKRAYVCDQQLSSWVSIRRTAFAALFVPRPSTAKTEAEEVRPLGALRGGPWHLSTRAARRLSGLLAALSVAAGALQLASGLAMGRRAEVARASSAAR